MARTKFQSTPAIAGGRTQRCFALRWQMCLFQSTPAIAGGRTHTRTGATDWLDAVSIHARHCWRANPFAAWQLALGRLVSIHARHCWRANPAPRLTRCRHARLFQSTPAIAGGRTRGNPLWARALKLFQSTPAIAGGRTLGSPDWLDANEEVSIHARHCWRANPLDDLQLRAFLVVSIHARHCWRANPCHRDGAEHALDVVSIHARHCWRANPVRVGVGAGGLLVSIHARHCWRANPSAPAARFQSSSVSIHARHCWRANHVSGLRPATLQMFQSTPAIAGGRTPDRLWIGKEPARFQSTPAIAGGRTRTSNRLKECYQTFQSTPAIAGGRTPQCLCCPAPVFVSFNPRPPLLAGEPRISQAPVSLWHGFNPRPPLLAGEPALSRDASVIAAEVSIHARHCWRANPRDGVKNGIPRLFQSTPAIAGGRTRQHQYAGQELLCFNPRPPLLAGEPSTA